MQRGARDLPKVLVALCADKALLDTSGRSGRGERGSAADVRTRAPRPGRGRLRVPDAGLAAGMATDARPVVAGRFGRPYSLPPLRKRFALFRSEYAGVGPVDRVTCEPGQAARCGLWFPQAKVQVGAGRQRVLPVLAMTLGFSGFMTAVMIASRQGGGILSGMWCLVCGIGRVTKTLVWDREAAIGGTGKATAPASAFAGTLATRIKLAPATGSRVRRPGRAQQPVPGDLVPARPPFRLASGLHQQSADWLVRANARSVRAIQGRPVDVLETGYLANGPPAARGPADRAEPSDPSGPGLLRPRRQPSTTRSTRRSSAASSASPPHRRA